MSKRIKLEELRTLLQNAIDRQERIIQECKGYVNPQLIADKNKAEGALGAYQSVLDALEGQAMFMRMAGEKNSPPL